jgi:hypothetical protein
MTPNHPNRFSLDSTSPGLAMSESVIVTIVMNSIARDAGQTPTIEPATVAVLQVQGLLEHSIMPHTVDDTHNDDGNYRECTSKRQQLGKYSPTNVHKQPVNQTFPREEKFLYEMFSCWSTLK